MIKKRLIIAIVLLLFSPAHAQISRDTTAHFNNWTLIFGTDVNCDVEIFHGNVFECSNSSGYALNSQIEVKSDNLINISLVNIFNSEWLNFSAVNTSANTEANFTIGIFQITDKVRVYHDEAENTSLGPFVPNSSGYIKFTWTFAGEKNFEFKVPPNQLDLNSPITDYNSSSTNITFNWTGYDSSTNLTTDLTIDGVVNISAINTNNGTSTPKNISGLAEGVHNWSVTIIDAGGNINSSLTYNFTIDLSPPDSFSDGSANPGVINKRENVAINITVTDVLLDSDTAIMEVTNPQSVKKNYTMTNGTGNEFTRSISGDDTDVLGTYYVDFFANDTVGNMNFSDFNLSFGVTKKSSPPQGGGGGSPRSISAFSKRMNVIDSSMMAGVIKELKLGAKWFYWVKREMAAVFAITGGRTGEFPAPKTDISSALTNPIEDVTGDIYETSATEVLKAWKSSGTVVIARGDLEVDSMAAIAYARSKNVPILLTRPNELPSFTLDAVKKLNARNFVILGGDVAVNGEVVDELEKIGSVTRIAGKDRYETSAEVAKSLGDNIDTIVIADGERPSLDAVIIALGYNAPVLYVTGNVVPKSTQDFVKAHRLTKRGKEVKLVLVDVSDYIINYRFDKDF